MELLKKVRPNLKPTLCWFWYDCLAWVRTAAPAPSNLPANNWGWYAAVGAFAIIRAKAITVSTSQRECRSLDGLACCTVAITRCRNILTINITAMMTMSTPMGTPSISGVAGGHLTRVQVWAWLAG